MKPELLPDRPEPIAPDTWLIPTLAADPAGGFIGAHSAVIRGAEPVRPRHERAVRPRPVAAERLLGRRARGRPLDLPLARRPRPPRQPRPRSSTCARTRPCVANYAMVGRLFGDVELPLERMRWINVGESLDVGDRELVMVRPPMFDSPATRGLLRHEHRHALGGRQLRRPRSRARSTTPTTSRPRSTTRASRCSTSCNTPWMEWVDPDALRRPRRAPPSRCRCRVVASAHGPLHRGDPHRRRVPPHARARRARPRPSSPDRTCSSSCARCSRPPRSEEHGHGNDPAPRNRRRGRRRSSRRGVGGRRRPAPHRRVEPRVPRGRVRRRRRRARGRRALPRPEPGRAGRLDAHVRDRRPRTRPRDQLAHHPRTGSTTTARSGPSRSSPRATTAPASPSATRW